MEGQVGREGWAADQIAGQPGWRGQKSSRRREALSSHEVLPVCVRSVAQLLGSVLPFDPMDCSPRGSSVHGIFQASILEWVAISSSRDPAYGPLIRPCLLICKKRLHCKCHFSWPFLRLKPKCLNDLRMALHLFPYNLSFLDQVMLCFCPPHSFLHPSGAVSR